MATAQITLISDAIVDCRLMGLNKLLQKQQYGKAIHVLNDTINIMQNGEEYECDMEFVDMVITTMYSCLVDMAFKRYDGVHNKLRDLHYNIMSNYIDYDYLI